MKNTPAQLRDPGPSVPTNPKLFSPIFVFYMYVPSVFRALDPTYFREPHKFQKEKQVFRFSVCSSRELSSPPIIAAATITLSPML